MIYFHTKNCSCLRKELPKETLEEIAQNRRVVSHIHIQFTSVSGTKIQLGPLIKSEVTASKVCRVGQVIATYNLQLMPTMQEQGLMQQYLAFYFSFQKKKEIQTYYEFLDFYILLIHIFQIHFVCHTKFSGQIQLTRFQIKTSA